MPVCIYCLVDKNDSGFTKSEHVLPQAFGKFEQNLTLLGVVCDDCNQFFGNELETPFARDTPDGLDRFILAGKSADKYKSMGRRTTMRFQIDGGQLAGAAVVQRPVEGVLRVAPIEQIGLSATGEPPISWFPLDELPTKEVFQSFFSRGLRHIQIVGVANPEMVHEKLRQIGLTVDRIMDVPPLSIDPVRVRGLARADDTFCRTLTKIALNYLAYVCGAEVALSIEFNDARRYARYGEQLRVPIVGMYEGSLIATGDPGRLWHGLALAVDPDSDEVIAQLSLHGQRRYAVRLAAREPFDGATRRIGHHFDLDTKQIREVAMRSPP